MGLMMLRCLPRTITSCALVDRLAAEIAPVL
jgi:hypothetical protein